ncbi:hypothetical protein FQN52_008289 [Onygenales sp. PD_12]|nr:hypothetical protein FQN52_008289 [Onygenales sp. PD_12]
MALNYNPDTDIPDLSGKVILITGGRHCRPRRRNNPPTSQTLPYHIYFAGRTSSAADSLIAELSKTSPKPITNPTYIPSNQSSLSSIASAAKTFLDKSQNQLDLLICNAGIMIVPLAVSKDGYEIQFAIVLARALRAAGGGGRIVSLTSMGFTLAKGVKFETLRSNQAELGNFVSAPYMLYSQSKLANILYASELARRYMNRFGFLMIKIGTRKLLHPETLEGAYNTIWSATAPLGDGGKNRKLVAGGLYGPVGQVVPHTEASKDENLAGELWEWTEKAIKEFL